LFRTRATVGEEGIGSDEVDDAVTSFELDAAARTKNFGFVFEDERSFAGGIERAAENGEVLGVDHGRIQGECE